MPPSINYDSPQEIRAFLEKNGLGMRKHFGQNFLINPGARSRLLDALEIVPGDPVWEVGPGLGAMTAGLLERGAKVRAFEIDTGFIKALGEFFGDNPDFTLIPGDVFKTWPETPAGPANQAANFLGNLPYNIAAALLADLIEKNRLFTRMVVTVQREVARRICASAGSEDYSSISVLCASAYTIKPLMVLKGASFYPAPRVDSQGIRFDIRTDIAPQAYPPLFRPLVRGLFASRRKTVKNNLQSFILSGIIHPKEFQGAGKKPVQELALGLLETCGIDPNERAENLGISEFSALAAALTQEIPGGNDGDRRGS
ncbi:dimethyladenosine transferase [Treponema primitia ZAS-2]|uniref:Ribosomal RNA small subunit methyltransferase A n=1 Tax=Treponema primitia (strain ATCC BAA-887 / DSM 12427 / ZAS-2) TaxID=545694 RepID=F5YIY7_TREPZ|nr:16S rRNA (adenine(1518)-N(6)/adenine(1519)-N(6))-dimethyltransferase RsmA [Treponema primitia]AEF84119.1 dimethyladenosine transferase [Treponema primitia ZAS-2]